MNTFNQEADMSYIKDFVSKIAEALVAATELPKQVENMQRDLAVLSGNLEYVKTENAKLDTMLADTRRQRDEAEQALSQVKADLSRAMSEKSNFQVEANDYHNKLQSAMEDIVKIKAERDDYGMKQMEAEDRAKTAEAKLDKLREAMGIPKEVPKPVEAQPVPQAYTAPTPEPTPPQPVTVPKRIYQGEPGYDMAHDKWDEVKQKYYSEEIPF